MRKIIKIFLSVISSLVLLAIIVPLAVSILLSSHRIQNWAAGQAMAWLSEKLGTAVTLDRVGLKLFNRVTLDGLYIEDIQRDTLLYIRRLDAGFRSYEPSTGALRLGNVRIDGADFRIAQDSSGVTNLKTILDRLKSRKDKAKKPFILHADGLRIDSARFRMQKSNPPDRQGAINFADLDVRDLSLDFRRIRLVNDSIGLDIHRLEASEKSGFRLREFAGHNVRVNSREIRIDDFRMRDDDSRIAMPELALTYPDWRAFGDFLKSVHLRADIDDSRVALRTIGRFAPKLQRWQSVVRLDGTVDGTVDDLSGQLTEAAVGATRLRARFSVAGLPEIDKARFNLEIGELATDTTGLHTLLRDMTGKEPSAAIQQWMGRLSPLTLSGTFEGQIADFEAEARLQAVPGEADFRLRVNPEAGGRTRIDGDVSLTGFQLGQLLHNPRLGSATLSARIDGVLGDSLALKTDAGVDHLHFNGYDYRNIRLDGEIRDRFYEGLIASTDPNADFRLDGTFDLSGEVPRYDFDLALNRLDLHALGLNRRDSISVLSARMQFDARGTTPDDLTGHGKITGLTYAFPGDTLRSEAITLTGDNLSQQKRIRFDSDFLEAELTSRLSLADLPAHAKNALRYYLPSLDTADTGHRTDSIGANDYYAFRAQVKESGHFLSAVLPGLRIEPATTASLLLTPATRDFSLLVNSPGIEYKNMYVANLTVTNRNRADSIALYVQTDEAGIGNFILPGLTVHGGVRENRINLSTGFDNPANGLSAMINTVSRLQTDTLTRVSAWQTRFTASRLRVGEQEWRISSPSIVWGREAIDIDRFRVQSTGQEFQLDGRLSALPTDTLHLSMNNFDLAPLTSLISRYGYGVEGRTAGRADLIAGRGDARFYGRIRFEDIRFNGIPVQNSTFSSAWNPAENRIGISLVSDSRDTVLLGGYRPDERRYDLEAHLPDIDMALLSPVLEGVLTGIEGSARADVTLTGTGKEPSLNGTITVPDFAATVDFTKARYHFSNATVRVENNSLILPRTPVYDDEGNRGDLELALRTRYFSQMSYEVKVTPRQMLALNTTERDNDYFYGKAYASGVVSIRGDRRRIDMEMNVTTENNSSFFLPLNGASSIAEADFIRFGNPNQLRDTLSSRRPASGARRRSSQTRSDLNIEMAINVRPNTEAQIVIDPKLGDIIKANGTGMLNLHIRPREDIFTLSGDYRISEGSYLFTLMNVLNKRFTIEPGSSIQWLGDPLDAALKVTATYRVRASAAPLGYNQVIPVDCRILLSDRLSQPTIDFDIVPAAADSELRNVLANAMNTKELKLQQFIWLLMSNSFYADNGQGGMGDIGTTATTVTGIEFLTNQLSNWLSSDRFSFNLGYTPRSELVSNELEAMMSSELIPGRLLLEGELNYNFADNQGDPRADNPISGDFYLTYVIDPTGLRAKVFTRTIDRYDENQGLQESGFGLYYQKDFERWRDLLRRRRRRRLNGSWPRDGQSAIPADSTSTLAP